MWSQSLAPHSSKHSEFNVALEICHRLMSTPFPDAWSICRYISIYRASELSLLLLMCVSELAAGDEVKDMWTRWLCILCKLYDHDMLFPDRTGLLQFALTHCPTSEIKRILQIMHTVETEHLYQQCTTLSSSSSDSVSWQSSGIHL